MAGRTDIFIEEVKDTLEKVILKSLEETEDIPSRITGNAGLLWAFSAAYGHFKKKNYLLDASKMRDRLVDDFTDHKFGGVFWEVDKNGERLDTSARLKGQGAAILALSEFYKATKDDEALKVAINIYNIVEKEFHKDGEYAETLTRDFQPSDEPKKSKSLLVLLEGYANLYDIWPDKELAGHAKDLLSSLEKAEFCPCNKAEASWAMLSAAFCLKDFDLVNEIRKSSVRENKSLAGDSCEGKLGKDLPEEIVADLWAWKFRDANDGAEKALKLWESVSKDKDLLTKGCPLHNVRMCVEALRIFEV